MGEKDVYNRLGWVRMAKKLGRIGDQLGEEKRKKGKGEASALSRPSECC